MQNSSLDPVSQIREICLALPEATEEPFGGHTAPSFRIGGKLFATISEDLTVLTIKGQPGVQQSLVAAEPDRYFVPKYVGHAGWVAIRLAAGPDWSEIAELIEESFRLIAPRRISRLIEGAQSP